ncbi:unnamed protein product [Symbiodinium necroappetens]|uniref:Prolyl 4-hydroxylase alpha subunit Fe(2+) 2OG dioxygenase domain-containing protein n=1 Tax=Symbiodinium necroappetens TaxID=1628268 RepID=A0A812NQ14_9DINO|nr:unnamed protein product [Symbiodinium necroappetens]
MVRWLGFLLIFVGAGLRPKNRVDWPWEEHHVSSSDEVQGLLTAMLAETTAEASKREAGDVAAQERMLREVVAKITQDWRSTGASTCHQQLGRVIHNFSVACERLRPKADWLLDYYVPVLPNKTCAGSISDIFALGDELVETLHVSRDAIASLDVDDKTLRRYQALSFLRSWLVNLTRTDGHALLWAGFWDGDPQNRTTQAKLSNFARATEHSTMHPNTFLGQAIEASQDLDACYKQATTNTLAENMWSIASMSFVLGMRERAQGTVIALVNKAMTGERSLSQSVLFTHEIPTVGLAAWGLGFWSPKAILLDLMGTCDKTSPALQKQLFARLPSWAKSMRHWSPAAFAQRSRLQWQCIDCSGACSLDQALAEHVEQLVKAKESQDLKDKELRQAVASPHLAVTEKAGLNCWEEQRAAHKLMGWLWNNPETRTRAHELKNFYYALHLKHMANIRREAENGVRKLDGPARLHRVEQLLQKNADPNAPDRHGNTALICAAIEGHLELVEPLLKARAQLESRNAKGTTAVMHAAANGHLEMIETLRKAGAQLEARHSENGFTPLMFAANKGNLNVAETLLQARVQPQARSDNGFTALMFAANKGHVKVAEALVKARAQLEARDDDGNAALTHATKAGIVENGYEIFNFAVLVDVECSGLIHILQLQQWDVGLGGISGSAEWQRYWTKACLCPEVDLVAKLYKVLLYEPGDFFQPHVDSKVGDDHILSLVVDCGAGDCKGGELCFPKRASQWRELEKIGRDRTWLSESGSWCCFFSSELHCVKEVTAGHRVMATFNVFGSPAQTENSETSFPRSSTQNCFLSVPRHAQQQVVLRSGTGSVYCCSCTCSFQRDLLGGPAQILQLWLGEFKERLQAEMGDKDLLGIPFHNMYSFDSSGVLRPHHLRGRDWFLYKALVALGWHCRLVECAVSCENGRHCKGLSRARIGQDMTDHPDRDDFPGFCTFSKEIEVPESFQALAGANTLSCEERSFLTDTNGELDVWETDPGEQPLIVWPFRGVRWAVSRAYFAKRLLGESKACSRSGILCGNGAQFRVYYYRRAALLCEMKPCDSTHVRRFDPDFYASSYRL